MKIGSLSPFSMLPCWPAEDRRRHSMFDNRSPKTSELGVVRDKTARCHHPRLRHFCCHNTGLRETEKDSRCSTAGVLGIPD